jgi:16S rRNA (cytidine1402-2'-O)-methyltransferase
MPTLYLVGTPIGNLEDISLRALRILREVSLIAAEDTRTTGRLLHHYQIETPLVSFHDYSGPPRIARLIARLDNGDIALVSDAGMPGLSDPGYELVRAAIAAGAMVSPIPGPAAAIAALVSSGLPTDSFLFLGFLPRQAKARRDALAGVAALPHTLILYESPHRLVALLRAALQELGDRQMAVGRELTKLYEEIWRGTIGEALAYFEAGPIRGEFTRVISGSGDAASEWDEARVRAALEEQLDQGLTPRDATALIAEQSGWPKRKVYALALPATGE